MYYILDYIIPIMRTLNRKKLQEYIEKTGFAPSAFAKEHGFSCTSIQRWLNGERIAKISNIQALATALNCSVEDITDYVYDFDQTQLAQLERDREMICMFFGQMTAEQRKSVLDVVALLTKLTDNTNLTSTHPEEKSDCTS
jgi:transcriptional regulator with XRE-family HTH domain